MEPNTGGTPPGFVPAPGQKPAETPPAGATLESAAPPAGVAPPTIQPPVAEIDPLTAIDWSPPSEEQIAAWKRPGPPPGVAFDFNIHGFGAHGVRSVRFPIGTEFFFRLLSRAEYKAIIYGPFSLEDRENEICRRCVLWPEGIDFNTMFSQALQGIPSMLVEYIMDQSGFLPAVELKKV